MLNKTDLVDGRDDVMRYETSIHLNDILQEREELSFASNNLSFMSNVTTFKISGSSLDFGCVETLISWLYIVLSS